MSLPFSEACERNQGPILEVLRQSIRPQDDLNLLEIGSGTGQHAVFFASHFPDLTWWPSDRREALEGVRRRCVDARLKNLREPQAFEVGCDAFPTGKFDLCFTANTFHILSWEKVRLLIRLWGEHLRIGARVWVYGPFNREGQFTSPSNEAFDRWLKEQDRTRGIRDAGEVAQAFRESGFSKEADLEMPAHNRMLCFGKQREYRIKKSEIEEKKFQT